MSITDRTPLFSVCIPAYNRPAELAELLDSVLAEDFADYEIVIAEDRSPQRDAIRAVVQCYAEKPGPAIRYFENRKNLGYDGNFRNLVELARGEYCLFMGNDDLLAAGALGKLAEVVGRHPRVGAVLRSYASFAGTPENVVEEYRYFDSERFFPAGPESVVTFFRRSVVISGLTLHRRTAACFATDRFDGTLLYQLHLVANILLQRNGVATPEIVALYRTGGVPDFGGCPAERVNYVPGRQTPQSSVSFVEGMMRIARATQQTTGAQVYRPILRDVGNYSYPFLQLQRHLPLTRFVGYAMQLGRLGLYGNALFHAYFWMLSLLGREWSDRCIRFVKHRRGATPALGGLYTGEPR